jgi:hypothetical protein
MYDAAMRVSAAAATFVALVVFASSCSTISYTLVPQTNAVDDRLYCGREMPTGGEVSDEELQTFLRDVVTPRFPEGLTIFAANGQWRSERTNEVGRERVMVIEIVHPLTAASDRLMREVADEYRRRFHQRAVLRVMQPATMQFVDGSH